MWIVPVVCVEIVVARRLLLVDGCWSRAQRSSLVLERTEGETSNFWKLRPTTLSDITY